MPYPGPFHRLVLMGDLYSDTFNTTLSIVPVSGTGTIGLPPPQDLLTPLESVISAFWAAGTVSGGAAILPGARLTGFKLNSIGPDGRYTENETHEHTYSSPIPGGGLTVAPAQLATVVTIRTSADRGLASKGRMFLPVCDGFTSVGSDGRAAAGNALRVAQAVADWFEAINAVYVAQESGDEELGRVGVASDRSGGMFRTATRVTVGRVTDTVRSRRNRQIEDPEEALITI